MRILNIVENLDKGAVENWLINIFENSIKYEPNWEWTFYCLLNKPGKLDERVKALGGKIIFAPFWISESVSFLKSLRKHLKNENYDIIHAHHDFLSGFYLISTIGMKRIKVINHIHNSDEILPIANSILKNSLLFPFATLAGIFADKTVGISKYTLKHFESKQLIRSQISKVLYYGIKLENFKIQSTYNLRNELNIDNQKKIILFIGRFNIEKNPSYLIDIASYLTKIRNDFVLVSVGQGDQEKEIDRKAKLYNCEHLVYKLGWRNDIAQIMLDSNLFVFPRLLEPKEGLGLVLVEAQSAGLPILCTNGILEDAIVIPELVTRLELNNPESWSLSINSLLNNPPVINKRCALLKMTNSSFEIEKATLNLIALYAE